MSANNGDKYIVFIVLSPNVSIHPRCTLCTVGVECLVGFHFHWLFLASLFQIVSAGFVTFVSLWWKVHCARGRQYIPDPTSALRLRRALAPITSNALFGFSFWLLGCSIPSSKSSFPPPNQAASAARRIFIFSIRTSAFMLRRALAPIAWNALLDIILFLVRIF